MFREAAGNFRDKAFVLYPRQAAIFQISDKVDEDDAAELIFDWIHNTPMSYCSPDPLDPKELERLIYATLSSDPSAIPWEERVLFPLILSDLPTDHLAILAFTIGATLHLVLLSGTLADHAVAISVLLISRIA